MINIEIVDTIGNYDYLNQCQNAFVYSTPRFMSLISTHLNAKSGWITAVNQDEIVGAIPFLKKEGPLGQVYNSLAYYGSNGGVIQKNDNKEVKILLIKAFYELAKLQNAISATIITNPLEQDSGIYDLNSHYDLKDERIGQITHFPIMATHESLMSHFSTPRPQNIRRALKEGVTVKSSHEHSDMKFLYETHVKNITAIKGLPKSELFFDLIDKYLKKEEWKIYIAELNNKPIAALLIFKFNQTVEYFTPAIVEEYRSTQALSLIIYQAMQEAIAEGFKNWNWGGTWITQNGVYDFKKRWGTSEYRYYYYTKIFDEKLRYAKKEDLAKFYSGFYLLPYSGLINEENIK